MSKKEAQYTEVIAKSSCTLLALFILSLDPAYSAELPAFYNFGKGATNGDIYTPASPAIDVRNLMDATWNLEVGNRYSEKYIFIKPYPHSYAVYKKVEKKAARKGLQALMGPSFQPNDLVEVEVGMLASTPKHGYLLNIADNKLINFIVKNPSTVSAKSQDENAKTLVTVHTMKKVLDGLVNMKGMKQANRIVKRQGQIILMASEDQARKPRMKVMKIVKKSQRASALYHAKRTLSLTKPSQKPLTKALHFANLGVLEGSSKLYTPLKFKPQPESYGLPAFSKTKAEHNKPKMKYLAKKLPRLLPPYWV